MTCAILLAALRFSKNAAVNRLLSNDLVKGLTLITLEALLDGWLCKLKAADHLQVTGELHYPPPPDTRKHNDYVQIPKAIPPGLPVFFRHKYH